MTEETLFAEVLAQLPNSRAAFLDRAVASRKTVDRKKEYADRAVELLARAVKAGYKNAEQLAKDRDLDPIRERADFEKLVDGLAGPWK
jgi:hypothetical protein